MPEGNDTTNGRRLINFIMNIFIGKSCRNSNVAGKEVIIDFRHNEMSDRNSPSPGVAGATRNGTVAVLPGNKEDYYTLINNSRQRKRSKEVKLSPGGIQGNGHGARLMINIEEGGGGGRRRKSRLAKRDEIEDSTTSTSGNSLDRIPSNINEKADDFIRSRKEAMIRNYYSSTNQIKLSNP